MSNFGNSILPKLNNYRSYGISNAEPCSWKFEIWNLNTLLTALPQLAGVQVTTLQDAHDLLEQILNSRLAPMAFGMALLLTGQMSTFTGTIAGQVVLSGFLNMRCSTFVRRLSTRGAAIIPAVIMQVFYGAPGIYKCAPTGRWRSMIACPVALVVESIKWHVVFTVRAKF